MVDEAELLAQLRCLETKREAFAKLIALFSRRLYAHIRRLVLEHQDTDDVLQNTFVKVWENIDNFHGDAQLFSWVYRIATNEALNFIRRAKRLQQLSVRDAEALLQQIASKDNSYFNADKTQWQLQQAILTLPEKQRVVFNLRYFDEMKYEQMAQILGVSVGTLKATYHIAARKIETFFK